MCNGSKISSDCQLVVFALARLDGISLASFQTPVPFPTVAAVAQNSAPMDLIFFLLPLELQLHTLKMIPNRYLELMFELASLGTSSPDLNSAYLVVRHLGLAAKYHNCSLVISNDEDFCTFGMKEMEYLQRHQVQIQPLEITLVFFDLSDLGSSFAYSAMLFGNYLSTLQSYTQTWHIRLILTNSHEVNFAAAAKLLQPLWLSPVGVNSFTVKYQPGMKSAISRARQSRAPEVSLASESASIAPMAVERAVVQLFNASRVLETLASSGGLLSLDNLKILDLSFNNLTDYDILQIAFPSSLEELRLANNQLRRLSNLTLPFRSLCNLRLLDLANNNILQVDFSGRDNDCEFSLDHIDLSGNLLSDFSSMYGCSIFAGLRSINLAQNLLDRVAKFPPQVQDIDLSGNYLQFRGDEIRRVFPRGLRKLSLSTGAPPDRACHEWARLLMQEGELEHLRELEICGSKDLYGFL